VIEHASEIIPFLLWMIVMSGGAIISLLIWIGQRIQKKVDEIPDQVAEKVDKIHAELIGKVDAIQKTQSELERDLRAEYTGLDRRLTKLETRCEITLQGASK